MNTHIKKMLNSGRTPLTSLLVAAGMALLFSAPLAQAKEKPSDNENWGKWQALGDGYVARRRQPPNLDLPKSERRAENVQARLAKLLKKKQHLLDSLEGLSGKKAATVQKKLRQLEKQISKATTRAEKFAAKRSRIKGDAAALWLHTGEEGLYKVSLADIASSMGMNARKLRKKAHEGKLVLAIATQMDSEDADRPVSWHFDEASDSLLFAGEAYDTFYSDENAYKLSLVESGENRKMATPMSVSKAKAAMDSGIHTPFIETLKFEEEPDLFFAPWAIMDDADADFWWWDYLYGGFKDTINVGLNIPNPADSGVAQLRISLRGWTNIYPGNEHEVSAELNGIPVGSSVSWDGFDQVLLVADFDQGILDPSGNNTLVLRNHYAAGTHPGQWLDQVEIDYQRMPVVSNGKLWMHDVTPGTQTVTGFTSDDIVVVESPGGGSKLRRDIFIEPDGLGGWSATFKVKSSADYLVQESATAVMPLVASDSNADLRAPSNIADYLVIAPRDFSDTTEALAQYRSSRYSNVKIVWLEDIFNEFSAGRVDPFALSRFMNHVANNWGNVPTDVVLIGKGTMDHKGRMEYVDSFLPILMTNTPWALAASDTRLLGQTDAITFTIGRLPITSDAEGYSYVQKLIAYESITPGSERFKAVLVADNPDDAGDFHENSDMLDKRLLSSLGFSEVAQFYHPREDVRANMTDSATWETGYVSYDGHGSVAWMGTSIEGFLSADDAKLLSNTVQPIYTALTCSVGDFSYPGMRSLAGALVLNPAGGAIASVAPTGSSYDAGAQVLGNALVENLFGAGSTIGQSLRDAKISTSGDVDGFMSRIYSVVGDPGVYAR